MVRKLIKLLANKDGTPRPVMLFRTVYRAHAKVRKPIVTKLELERAAGRGFNNSPGENIIDEVYRTSLRNVLAMVRAEHEGWSEEAGHTLEILWDLRKAFEQVDRQRLWEKGESIAYPPVLLRLSLRTHTHGGGVTRQKKISSGWIKAAQGVAAGSAFATQELKLCLS